MIVEEERLNKGKSRYGERLMVELSSRLSDEFCAGYGKTNLFLMRLFFIRYPIFNALSGKFITSTESIGCGDSVTLRSELSWTHYRLLLRVEKPEARAWYINKYEEELRREIERERDLVIREQMESYG